MYGFAFVLLYSMFLTISEFKQDVLVKDLRNHFFVCFASYDGTSIFNL